MWTLETEFESEDDSESEYLIFEESENQERALNYALYSQLKFHKDHFSNMQNRYRALSSTWFLAALAGIGYVLAQHEKLEIPFNILLAVILLCFCAGFGILLLWHLDIILYRKLWLATVVELARLEEKHRWLPCTNLNILQTTQNKYRCYQSLFYIGINSIFLIIIGITALLYFSPLSTLKTTCILFSTLILIYTLTKKMLKHGGELEEINTKSFKKDPI